ATPRRRSAPRGAGGRPMATRLASGVGGAFGRRRRRRGALPDVFRAVCGVDASLGGIDQARHAYRAMKRFTYTAVDAHGLPAQGTVDAADWGAALRALAARGLGDCRQVSAEDLPALTSADAAELAGYLSELARAGLPLGGSLRVLAQDAPSGALRKAIDDLSAKIDAGHPLESALESLGARLPEHVRRLLV